MKKLPYIPDSYIVQTEEKFQIWFSLAEDKGNISYISDVVRNSLSGIEKLLKYSLQRKLHICLYETNKAAKDLINRDIPLN